MKVTNDKYDKISKKTTLLSNLKKWLEISSNFSGLPRIDMNFIF